MRISSVLVALLLALTACSGQEPSAESDVAQPTESPSSSGSPPESPAPSDEPASEAVTPLVEGPVPAGRHRFALLSLCDPKMGCPKDEEPALPTLEVTVPGGWDAATEVASLFPSVGRDTTSRSDPALAMGWPNFWVGLNSQPCSAVSHQQPDIEIGPTVDDFVDAVVAHPRLDVTKPKPVSLGRYDGQFFSLIGPKDISDCKEWRPWDPGPYLQGEENRWDVWVMDVDGIRVVIMAEYFPETPKDIKSELRAMAESIRFTPAKA